jgi:small conductance mechanosensitive channel
MDMQTRVNEIVQSGWTLAVALGIRVLEAIALWIVGRWLISLALRMIGGAMTRQKIDPTVIRYIQNAVAALLNIILVIAILGFFGVQTTSLAALIAAAGVAIGMAWSGLLSNFAAGVFLVILQPLKVGDFVSAGGVTGTVHEIGLFVTTFNTPDNVLTHVGNNKIFSDTIQNFSANPYRRVDLTAQIAGSADPRLAIERLKERIGSIANVLKTPAPDVTILTFSAFGPVLAVRPYCHNDHYWQVYFDSNMTIREVLGDAAFPGPAYPLAVHDAKAAAGAA